MKTNPRILIVCGLFLLTLSACDVSINVGSNIFGGEVGSGVKASEKRAITNFSRVHSSGSINVDTRVGDTYSVVVSGDDNLIPLISTEVRNGTLVIGSTGSFSTKMSLLVEVIAPSIEELSLSGSGNISLQEAAGNSLKLGLAGSGNISASGRAESLSANISGSGNIQAFGIEARTAKATISGSGNIDLSATSEIDAKISGSGNIRYRGKPGKVSQNVSGSGKVQRVN